MKKLFTFSLLCLLPALSGCAQGSGEPVPQQDAEISETVTKTDNEKGIAVKHFKYTKEDIAAGKYDVYEIIDPLFNTVSIDGLEKYNKDLEPYTEEQRKMLALLWYDLEVNNGGHDQFFFNSSGVVWKDALDCMRMIGADGCADNFQKAIDMFGGSVPFDESERSKALDKLSESEGFDGFNALDDFYYDNNPYQLMNDYIKAHPDKFVIDGDYPCYE